jgi:hypothetical protein
MTDFKRPETIPLVRALRIVLVALVVLYGLVFVAYAISFISLILPPFAFKPFPGLAEETKAFLDKVVAGPLYFFIATSIFKLIRLISRGEPFNPASPRHIRWIGFSVLGLAVIHAIGTGISEYAAQEAVLQDSLIRILYGGLSTLLLGFGFLVIAKVLEVGVALKQDQDLTV